MSVTEFRTIFAHLSQPHLSCAKKRGLSKTLFFTSMLFEKGVQAFNELMIGLQAKNISLCCQKTGGVYITMYLCGFCLECAEARGIIVHVFLEEVMFKCTVTARHSGPDVWLLFAVPPSHGSSGLDRPWQGKICPHQRLLHAARAESLLSQIHLLQ